MKKNPPRLPRQAAVPAAFLILAALGGCGGNGTGTGSGEDAGRGGDGAVSGAASCTLEESLAGVGEPTLTLEICQELVGGATASDIESLRQTCVSPSGTADAGPQAQARFRTAPCPHEHALGGCRIIQAGKTIGNWYYQAGSGEGMSPESIQQLCALLGGTFVPA